MSKSSSITELKELSAAIVGLVAGTAPSLVSVSSGRSRSSGFVWRPGLIVTADKALSEDGELTVKLWNGDVVATQLVGRDPSTDIALLRLERANLQPISLTAAAVDVGALVIAVGAEDGQPTAASGVVSRNAGPWRSLRGGEIDARIELSLRLRESAEGRCRARRGPTINWNGGVWTSSTRSCHTLEHNRARGSKARNPRLYRPRLSRSRSSACRRRWG